MPSHSTPAYPQHLYIALSESAASLHALKHTLTSLIRRGDSLTIFLVAESPEAERSLTTRTSTLVSALKETYQLDTHVSIDAVCGEPGPKLVEQVIKHKVHQLIIGVHARSHYVMTGVLSVGAACCVGRVSGYILEHMPVNVCVLALRYAVENPVDEEL